MSARETEIWAKLYPSDKLTSFAPTHVLVGGRRKETERHLPGLRRELPVHEVFGLLRTDATYCATVATVEQQALIEGKTKAELTGDEAMWAGSPEDLARQKWWKERAIEEHKRTWGQPPAEFG